MKLLTLLALFNILYITNALIRIELGKISDREFVENKLKIAKKLQGSKYQTSGNNY